jgi:hypothetical protein
MKQLKKYIGKDIEITFANGEKIFGCLYQFYKDESCDDRKKEYWLLDGNCDQVVMPKNIAEIKILEEEN